MQILDRLHSLKHRPVSEQMDVIVSASNELGDDFAVQVFDLLDSQSGNIIGLRYDRLTNEKLKHLALLTIVLGDSGNTPDSQMRRMHIQKTFDTAEQLGLHKNDLLFSVKICSELGNLLASFG